MRYGQVLCRCFFLISILPCMLVTTGFAQKLRSGPEVRADTQLYFPDASGKLGLLSRQLRLDGIAGNWTRRWRGLETVGSSSVLVLSNGRILAEQHWDADSKNRSFRYQRMLMGVNQQGQPIEDVASVQKSVTSILIGIAQQKKLLNIESRVSKYLGAGWSKSTPEQEDRITVRHLLSMTSGLNETLQFVAPAGNRWFYNTPAYAKSRDCFGFSFRDVDS